MERYETLILREKSLLFDTKLALCDILKRNIKRLRNAKLTMPEDRGPHDCAGVHHVVQVRFSPRPLGCQRMA